GELVAWDPVAQKPRWVQRLPMPWTGGVLATDGGLVFHAAGRQLSAYAAGSGKRLWAYDTGANAVAPAVTYAIKGQQYVALMVGYGGGAPVSASVVLRERPRLPGRLMVFKLGGKAVAKPYDIPVVPDLELTGVNSTGDAKAGFALFHNNCQVCHGPSASGAYLPDLKKSQMLLAAESWKSVVIDGALKDRGMAGFARFLTPKDAEDIRAYVLTEARNAQSGARPAKVQGAR
ncbi:MAG: c-type cytochrome, partial [Pseudomonadota bacterium]